jgi:two-component system, chemotaxis family, CheB/CheR fusion protein
MAEKEKVGRKQAVKRKPLETPQVESPAREEAFRIVGIGASAGGLEAFEQFFENMPSDKNMAFVIVQHLDPTGHSSKPQILSRFTRMPVKVATDGMPVEPNSIYLLPPNKNMGIQNGALYLQEPTRPPGLRLPIDFFFRSLAKEEGADTICIILSGTGTDGTLGLQAIKAELGTVFVQDPESAKYDGMPRSAIETGLADFILKPSDMPEKLIQFVEHSAVNGAGFGVTTKEAVEPLKEIFASLRARTGHDFSRYKQTTIRRRLQRRMSVNQISDVSEYARFLKENKDEIKALLKDLLISVTNFFRDPEAFEALKRQLRELINGKPSGGDIRVWVAGCATGEEAYSVAMVIQECLEELDKHLPVQMYGTDIDVDALHVARTGKYPANIAADVTPNRLKRFFVKENDIYRVKKGIREAIVFAAQNFIKDPPFSRMDLICCRNLLIYLESDVQKRLLPLLHYALRPGGILFLGPSETTGESVGLFALVERKWKIYKRREKVVPADKLQFPAAFAPKALGVIGEPIAMVNEGRIPELAEKTFLDSYAPTFAVIDEKYHLVYVRGRTGRYLEIASGQLAWSILDMAREGLRTELASAIYRAAAENTKIVHEGVRVKTDGGFQTLNLTVAPLNEPGIPSGLLMIVFQEVGSIMEEARGRQSTRGRRCVVELEDQLQLTKENLQTTIEELEATNEELKSANEELQSNNEELQSTNEELDTSREELQSLNEELTTLNAEIQDKNDLLAKANDDLKNFLNRTDIALIFLDEDLKIRSYTPATWDVFNMRDVDVGRPLGEITSRLAYEDVISDAQEVLRSLNSKEIEVQRRDGCWYKMRILPYRTAQNVVSGLVMSFLDIDEQKKAVESLRETRDYLNNLIDYANAPVIVWDPEFKITRFNHAFERLTGRLAKEVLGKTLEILFPDESRAASMERVSGTPFSNHWEVVEIPIQHVDGSTRTVLWNSATLLAADGKTPVATIAQGVDITERTKAEEASRDNEEKLRIVSEFAYDWEYWRSPDNKFIYMSPSSERFTGYPNVEFINDFNLYLRIIHPDDRERVETHMREDMVRHDPFEFEFRIMRRDGQERWISHACRAVLDTNGNFLGRRASNRDITELKREQLERERLNAELADRLAELQSLLDTAPIAIWICRDPECHAITGNIHASKLFGVEQGANISWKAPPGETAVNYRVFHEGVEVKPDEFPVQIAVTTGKPVAPDEFQIIFEDGRRLYMLIGAVPLVDSEGHTRGAVAVGANITEQKLQIDIKDEFIGMVSHELRTPLTVIIGALSTATDERASNEEKEELIQEAASSAESLASILDNMLELSRYQAGRLNLDKKPATVFGIAQRAAQRVRRKYDTHNIILDISGGTPDVDVDAVRIEQVIYNLMENAVKYSPNGSEVRVFSRQEEEGLVVGISDQGIGIAPEDQPKLFVPFARLKGSGPTGVGLGLVVCRRLVEAHGGCIWVESQPGKGSTFLFSIPYYKKEEAKGSMQSS